MVGYVVKITFAFKSQREKKKTRRGSRISLMWERWKREFVYEKKRITFVFLKSPPKKKDRTRENWR